MASYKTYKEIADDLGVSIDTVRRNVKSHKSQLNLELKKQKTPLSKGALVDCLSLNDAEKFIQFYKAKGTAKSKLSNNRNYGFFYIIQLIPEFDPNRVKIGFADDVDKRFREHQTSSPTAKLLASWPCKRAWDQAVMDSVTRIDCKLVLNEVYEGDIQGFIERANDFFRVMPDPTTDIMLSEHSPLKKNSH
jgi:hypothetical protein